MNCSEALDLLLEADLLELEGKGDSELASHVRGCPECHAAAGHMLEGQRMLGDSFSRAGSKTPVERALRLVHGRVRRSRVRRRMLQTVVPLAAAAAVTGIVIGRSGRGSTLEHVWESNPSQVARGLDLVTPPGKDVAVFELEDRPDIVVVWFFEKGE